MIEVKHYTEKQLQELKFAELVKAGFINMNRVRDNEIRGDYIKLHEQYKDTNTVIDILGEKYNLADSSVRQIIQRGKI